jgi:hypothetical protein
VWHASVGLFYKGKVQHIARLSEINKGYLIAAAKSLLSDVGQTPSAVEQYELAMHYRRSLTDEEIAALPQEWCAIPPVDEGGLGIVLERDT